jgi:signal transduction histidine kinase
MALNRVDRALILSFAAVVVSFVSATIYSQHWAGAIERAALSIQEDAAPSIRHLADGRAELRRLRLLVHRAVDDGVTSRRTVEIDTGRALLDSEIAEYRRLPMYAGEAVLWQGIEMALSNMDMDIAAILDALKRGDLDAARAGQDRLDASSETAARRMSAAIDFNAAEASRLAADIRDSRRRGMASAIELDTAGVALAALAATLALRISRQHARTVQALRDVAERRADELDTFATNMAHDVRSPLAAASLAFAVTERHRADDDRLRRAIARGHHAVVQTINIVEALLDFARAGARPQRGARASVGDVAEDIANVMRTRAEEIGAEIVVRTDSSSLVPCSDGVLASALGNLVGNALTYIDGAAVRRVTIDVTDEGATVKTIVADTGPGLPSNVEAESLFEPYVRGKEARGRGLGLGLATVKRIVAAHGGQLGVCSSAAGCQFWFTLPVAPTGPPMQAV